MKLSYPTFILRTGKVWHSQTDWNIATPMGMLTAAMIPLHLLKFGELRSSSFRVYEFRICTIGFNQYSG